MGISGGESETRKSWGFSERDLERGNKESVYMGERNSERKVVYERNCKCEERGRYSERERER